MWPQNCRRDLFERNLEALKEAYPLAHKLLTETHDKVEWAVSACRFPRWGKLATTIAESANAAVEAWRREPVPVMCSSVFVWAIEAVIKNRQVHRES